ncbi:MAG: DnaJ domain-containing protein [Chrysiogenetes bacterium]|nr:DnaJ domain-containing protein [Chrysiogenetes bacterium]
MEQTIPLDAIPVMVPGADFSKLKLGAQEGFLLSRIDGITNVKGVCAVSNLPEAQTLELLTSLAQDGVVQFKDKSGAQLMVTAPDTSGIDSDTRRRIQAIHRAEDQQNPYEILGVPRDSKLKDIKLAYYGLTELLHPDNFYGQEVGDWEEKIDRAFTAVTKAYEDLSDPDTRAKIDNRLKLLLGPDKVKSKTAAKSSGPSKPKVTRQNSAIFQAVKEKIQKARELADGAERQLHDGDFMGAYSSYKLASTYDPYNDEYKRNLAMLEGKVGKIRAGNDFKQALRKIDMHETDDAIDLLRKVVDADRSHAAARYELARLLMPKMKRGGQSIQQEALEMAESAAILESEEVEYLMLAAQINRALGDSERAKELYKDVTRIDKKNDVAKKALKEL